ncbi:MAG: DEAD/DEAH box helicase [Candidatus Aenigmarchaeota archaeon]|nr:DEAD/DEAH box helicase [Candidatus Aenigmarchaeota archaeon]
MKIEDLNTKTELLKALKDLEYTEFTPIQEKCIPNIREGKDVVGQSSTGSGKTVAFGLPILEKIEHDKGLQCLILTPTRELCLQVTDVIKDLGKYLNMKVTSVYGGAAIEPQIHNIQRADIVVGTPGRIIDHMKRRTINFDNVKFLVLDEADRMFDMGFIKDIEYIIRNVPKKRQTLLFSATIPHDVHKIIERHLHSPVYVKTQTLVAEHLLKQVYYDIKTDEKFSLLVHLLKKNPKGMAIVFCGTRREADVVGRNLYKNGINCLSIHGGMKQGKRIQSIEALKNDKIKVLVATDVAARGLDIRNVSHIYNYDVPNTAEEYLHRIGRTARAGDEGDAVTLLTERDHDSFRSILRNVRSEIARAEKPEFENVYFERRERFSRPSFGYNRDRSHTDRERIQSNNRRGRGFKRIGSRFGNRNRRRS